jgi:penicillin-binding protein 1C
MHYELKSSRAFILRVLISASIIWFTFCLPNPIFKDPTATILTDANGELLNARIAADGQWRFPTADSVPLKFEKSILFFEDQYFRYHLGINPVSIIKSIIINIKAGKTIRGGSTITSQVIRLSRKGKQRTVSEKLKEFILAFRLELSFSKDEILNLYASHAPFGGNVVGLEAASWRYYGRPSHKLSWGESATLAVLPNAPSLIYPGKNHKKLYKKRNRLLDKLFEKGIIDSMTCELSKYEPLPDKPKPLPQLAPHLIDRVIIEGNEGSNVSVNLQKKLQEQTVRIVNNYYNALINNEIYNSAAIIIEVETGKVLAYVGNSNSNEEESGRYVDIVRSLRSSGSTLKPFLYALMLKEGLILPNTLIPDVPTQIAGFNPKNFNKGYDGAVPASNALARSLNIPAVRMLRKYGLEKFHLQLPDFGITSINEPAGHYGLTLILGGAEVSLWELSSAYAGMARMLNRYTKGDSEYFSDNYHRPIIYTNSKAQKKPYVQETDIFEAGPVYLTFEALTEMNRPVEGNVWRRFSSSQKIAWKTGTSFGHRDAWAIGVTSGFVVGTWVGNADGEGRPGLTGASSAAPLMFEIFKTLPESDWFEIPYDDLIKISVCKKSGYQSTNLCDETDSIYVPVNGMKSKPCPFHKRIFLDETGKHQVTGNCYPVKNMITKNWFVLPTVMEWYYKSKDPFYVPLPSFLHGCSDVKDNLDIIYPQPGTQIFIPRSFGSEQQQTVFEAAHRNPSITIYWHIDDEYIGATRSLHKMEIFTKPGEHLLTLVSEDGELMQRRFYVIDK